MPLAPQITQALSVRDSAALRGELFEAKQAVERIRGHFAEAADEKNKEVARVKVGEKERLLKVNGVHRMVCGF